jgi:hypothetical protein
LIEAPSARVEADGGGAIGVAERTSSATRNVSEQQGCANPGIEMAIQAVCISASSGGGKSCDGSGATAAAAAVAPITAPITAPPPPIPTVGGGPRSGNRIEWTSQQTCGSLARCVGGGALMAGSSRSSTFADSQRLALAYPLDDCGG